MIHRRLVSSGIWRLRCANVFSANGPVFASRFSTTDERKEKANATAPSTAPTTDLRGDVKHIISYITEKTPPGEKKSRQRAIYQHSAVEGINRLGPTQRSAEEHEGVLESGSGAPSNVSSKPIIPVRELYTILRRHAARGSLEEVELLAAYLIKEKGEPPNLKLYSAMILCNINPEKGSAARVTTLYRELEEDGLVPDSVLFHDALKVLAIHPDCIIRGRLLEEMRQRWITLTENGWHDVVTGYIREGQLEQALEGLDEMRQTGAHIQGWLYDMISYALCDIEELDEALRIMQDRVSSGDINISPSSWYYLFDVGCKLLHHPSLQFVWQTRVAQQYLNPSSGQCLQVLNAASRESDVQLATDVFKLLSERGVTCNSLHYEMLLEAYVRSGDIYTALTVLCIMKKAKVLPDDRATRTLTKYLEQSSDLSAQAFSILQDLEGRDRDIPTAACNSVLEATIESIGLEAAIEQYKTLHQLSPEGPNTNTFNILLSGCKTDHRKDTAMFLASEMLALKVKPDMLTYDHLLLICLQEDDYRDAFRYYNEMRELGLIPRRGTLQAMVRKCGEVGDERAWEILDAMKDMGFNHAKLTQWLVDNGKGMTDSRPQSTPSYV